jgi:hypothetical protein
MVRETPTPGGVTTGGFAPTVVVQVPPGRAIASGVAPQAIVWPALLPPLGETLQRIDQLSAFHAHPSHDHDDSIALYTDIGVSLTAFVIAILLLLRQRGPRGLVET